MKISQKFLSEQDKAAAEVIVWATQADGAETPFTFSLKLDDVSQILSAHRARCEQVAKASYENGCQGIRDSLLEMEARLQGALRAGKWSPPARTN